MSKVSEEKSSLRERGLAQRRTLSVEECRMRSATVLARLNTVGAYETASLVLTYAANKDREVDTLPLIAALIHEGRQVAVPAMAEKGGLLWKAVSDSHELVSGRFGILEPGPACLLIKDFAADAVALVPGILFSPDGYRIGYGGAYFDRFLRDSPVTSIGLAFDFQLFGSIPVEPHDEPVDWVVCESAVYDCRKSRLAAMGGS